MVFFSGEYWKARKRNIQVALLSNAQLHMLTASTKRKINEDEEESLSLMYIRNII